MCQREGGGAGACPKSSTGHRLAFTHRHQTVPNAFMAAPPRHPFFAQLILGLERSRNAHFHLSGNPLAATGPIYLAKSLFRWVSLEVRRQ